jgi:hypothetical protein
MTNIIINKDCGNSPKNLLLQKMTIAFAEANADFVLGIAAEDIYWHIIGEKIVLGKASFTEALVELKTGEVEELTILHAISHGKVGAVHGRKKMSDGRVFAFCDVYEFKGASFTSVKEISSFLVELK